MTSPDLDIPESLGGYLERSRLEHRARRIERALAVLRERRRAHAAYGGEPPAPLDHAISDFGRELSRVRTRLRALA